LYNYCYVINTSSSTTRTKNITTITTITTKKKAISEDGPEKILCE
jgi:hypothetical protein